MKKITILLAVLLLSGCSTWTKVSQPRIDSEKKSFSIAAPNDWLRASHLNTNLSVQDEKGKSKSVDVDRIILTRDGLSLQSIEVARLPGNDAFPSIGKAASNKIIASELANLFLANMKKGEGLTNLEVLKISPDKIAGNDGFRLHVRFKNSRGLTFERLIFGFANNENFYHLSYQAPRIHYFNNYVTAFMDVLNSFELSSVNNKA